MYKNKKANVHYMVLRPTRLVSLSCQGDERSKKLTRSSLCFLLFFFWSHGLESVGVTVDSHSYCSFVRAGPAVFLPKFLFGVPVAGLTRGNEASTFENIFCQS